MLDELFPEFQKAYPGLTAISSDWAQAKFEWRVLDGHQKLAAIAAVKLADPAFVKLPHNFLRHHEWERPTRPAAKSKLERILDGL